MQLEKHNQGTTLLRLSCSQLPDIKGILLIQVLKCGAKTPGREEIDLITASVQRNFPDYNLPAINDAFDWYASLPLDAKMQHYGTFSYEYTAQVLSSFKRHLVASGGIVSSVDKERTYIPAERQLGNGEGKLPDNEVLELSKSIFESTGNVNYIIPRAYDILKLSLTDAEKSTIKRQAVEYLGQIYEGQTVPDYEKTLNRMCKKIAVSNYFKSNL